MMTEKKEARRPSLCANAASGEPGEGRISSPSNPTVVDGKSRRKESRGLDVNVAFRCTPAEKKLLIEKAQNAGLPYSDLLREALGLVSNRRRKPIPKIDPEFIRAINRIGSNINQIARWVNHASATGRIEEVEAATLASELIAVDRALRALTISAKAGALPRSEQC